MSKFKKGDIVVWMSQSGGFTKEKTGIIVAVVPPQTPAGTCLPQGCKSNSSLGYGFSRDHESYLVQIGKSSRLYWPLVKNLSLLCNKAKRDTRYPYTYAGDLIRHWAGYGDTGTKISRSDASQIRQGVAKVLGMDDEDLAKRLADFYKANQDSLSSEATRQILKGLAE